jgi:plasmid stability protein
MAILHVRNVPDNLYERLKERAAAERRTLSAEVIALLESELATAPGRNGWDSEPGRIMANLTEVARAERERTLRMSVKELLAGIDRTREQHPLPPGAPDVVEVIREGRDRR